MKTTPNPFLLTLAVSAALLAQAKPASNQPEDYQRRASEWDHATAERLFRKGAWREGIAYLGRALRLDPQNSAAARHLWSAVVDGVGDRNTLPALVLRPEAEIHSAVFSPDGRRILMASADKTARLWDATTGAPVGEPMRHDDEVVAAVFSPDGTRIATASKDGTARLWDAATGKALGAPMRHEHPLDGVAFNSTGTRIVTQSNEAGVARLWDAARGGPIGEAMPHSVGYSEAATFSADGSRLITKRGETARIWDSMSGKPIGKALKHPGRVSSAAFSPDGSRILTVTKDGKARVWSIAAGRVASTLSMKHSQAIDRANFSPDGTRIVTFAAWSGELWDAATGRRVGALPASASSDAEGGASSTFSPDGGYALLSCSDSRDDKFVRPWDFKTGEAREFSAKDRNSALRHPEEVLEVFFASDGMRIVTTCQDGAVRIWDAESGGLIGQPLRHDRDVNGFLTSVSASPDGTRILTLTEKNIVRVWEVDAGQPPAELLPAGPRAPEPITGAPDAATRVPGRQLAVSADDTRVLTATDPYTVQLSISGEAVGEPLHHADTVGSATFSPDGATFVVVCNDGIVRLWDAHTAMPVSEPLQEEFVDETGFTADGARFFTKWQSRERVREVPPMLTGAGLPPAFVEALSGYRFSDDGVLRELPALKCATLRAELRTAESLDSAWRPLIRWWLSPLAERPLSPGGTLTRREQVDREGAIGIQYYEKIHNAYLMDPTHPLVHIALAGLEEGKRADFLRAYDIARLPDDPAIRARAAEMLIKQGQPDLARKVTGTKSAK